MLNENNLQKMREKKIIQITAFKKALWLNRMTKTFNWSHKYWAPMWWSADKALIYSIESIKISLIKIELSKVFIEKKRWQLEEMKHIGLCFFLWFQ